jgi:N-acetyl-anhydromuramyl-L-alanine amidase AmpD
VPVSRVAFHAGKSKGPQGVNVNEYSVGIALANWESKDEFVTPQQVAALEVLVGEIRKAELDVRWLTTHYWVSPGRKTDPRMLSKKTIDSIAGSTQLRVWRG